MGEFEIRAPREDPDEVIALARLHVETWRQAYASFLPERFFDESAYEQRKDMWAKICSAPEHRGRVLVAANDHEIAGFSMYGSPRDSDVDVDTELYMMYVDAEHYGSGIASQLLTELIQDRSAVLWVFKDNPRARAFYEKHGFVADGTEKDLGDEEHDESLRGIREIRMIRR